MRYGKGHLTFRLISIRYYNKKSKKKNTLKMSKYYYLPKYTGNVYLKLNPNEIDFDAQVVDTCGLVDQLSMHAGVHYEYTSGNERHIAYYNAAKSYFSSHPNDCMAASFNTDEHNTATALLDMRDKLVMSGWNMQNMPLGNIPRMQTIAEIEEIFKQDYLNNAAVHHYWGMEDMLVDFIEKLQKNEIEIKEANKQTVYCYQNRELYQPLIGLLLTELEAKGVTINEDEAKRRPEGGSIEAVYNLLSGATEPQVEENGDEAILHKIDIPNDGHFLIYHFKDFHDETAYLVNHASDEEKSVWINTDNKAIDSWLAKANRPTVGSEISSGDSQVSQMLIIGLHLFERPLSMNMLLQWLYLPIHPLAGLRPSLVYALTRTGGYQNSECKTAIENYLTDENKRKAQLSQRAKYVKYFLPEILDEGHTPISIDRGMEANTVKAGRVRVFLEELDKWCYKKLGMNNSGSGYDPRTRQLYKVRVDIASVKKLYQNEHLQDEDNLSYAKIEQWIEVLSEPVSLEYQPATVGSKYVVPSSHQILAETPEIMWCDCYQYEESPSYYQDFLPTEMLQIKQLPYYWSSDNEHSYKEALLLQPFKYGKKLILVTCDGNGSEAYTRHPFIIKLMQCVNRIEDLTSTPPIENIHEVEEDDCFSQNWNIGKEISIERSTFPYMLFSIPACDITWPTQESATSLDNLLNSPLDYAFKYLAKLKPKGQEAMPKVSQLQGNVAHAVIEKLFTTYCENGVVNDHFKEQVRERYNEVFNQIVEQQAEDLLRKENLVETKLFRVQLNKCIASLMTIIEKNNLTYKGSEVKTSQEEGRLLISAGVKRGFPISLYPPHLPEGEPNPAIGMGDHEPELNIEENVYLNDKGSIDMELETAGHQPVIIDFKWTSSPSSKYELLDNNRSVQLSVYAHYLSIVREHDAPIVGYYTMPEGKLYVTDMDNIMGENVVFVPSNGMDKIFELVQNTYYFRRYQIEKLRQLEDAENVGIKTYKSAHIYPRIDVLNAIVRNNIFSDYKSFKTNRDKDNYEQQ